MSSVREKPKKKRRENTAPRGKDAVLKRAPVGKYGFDPVNAAGDLWRICPGFKDALDCEGLEFARERIYGFLLNAEVRLDTSSSDYHSLERLIILNSLRTLRHLIRRRNEELSGGISALACLHALARREPEDILDEIEPGFIEEIKHILLGLSGRSGTYADGKVDDTFEKLSGREAALARSEVLDRLSTRARGRVASYVTGLEPEIIELRKENARRISAYFSASEDDWNDWKWQLRHIIRDHHTLGELIELTAGEIEAIDAANKNHLPFGITPYYVSLMDAAAGGERDRGVRAQVIPGMNYIDVMSYARHAGGQDFDFMGEKDTSPVDLVTRRYPQVLILKPYNTCAQICVYCQRNWEVSDVLDPHAEAGEAKLTKAIEWIGDNPNITEVLVTGGDPAVMPLKRLERIIDDLASIDHVERIRLATRVPVVLPQKIDDDMVGMLVSYSEPGRREICVVTHFEHVYEVTPESRDAVWRLKSNGISVYNQLVYTIYNSRRFEAVALRRILRLIGVDPYYTFNAKGKEETIDFRIPIARVMMEQKEEARLFPGLVRTDELVFNVPRLGKNYITHQQDHRLIMIRPDGRRVYEFLPWERNISLVDSYIYTDVSIYSYLKKLEELGEDPSDYGNIWYYY